jgi:hypothetical protein
MLLQRRALSALRLGGGSHDRYTAPRFCWPTPFATEEIIATVHARRAPMMSAAAGLQL